MQQLHPASNPSLRCKICGASLRQPVRKSACAHYQFDSGRFAELFWDEV